MFSFSFHTFTDPSSIRWNAMHNMPKRYNTRSIQATLSGYTGTVFAIGVWLGHWSNGLQFKRNVNYILCGWRFLTVNIFIYLEIIEIFHKTLHSILWHTWLECQSIWPLYTNNAHSHFIPRTPSNTIFNPFDLFSHLFRKRALNRQLIRNVPLWKWEMCHSQYILCVVTNKYMTIGHTKCFLLLA